MKKLTILMLGNVMILILSCRTVDLAKKYPNMIANVDPFSVGVVEAQFDRFFSSKVNKLEVQTVFHPRLNAVSLEFKYELYNYKQFWDEPARKQFAASLELYKKDFDNKKLIDKYRKTKDVYGNVKGRLEWEAFKYTKTRVSNPKIELGYRFKENTPFFTTLMRTAREEPSETDNKSSVDSPQINMYFTRTQADELVKLFDQVYLLELLNTGAETAKPEADAAGVPYSEYEDPQAD
jgi:hypothetical protein